MYEQRQITAEQAKIMIEKRRHDPNLVLVDKRTHQEYAISHNDNNYDGNQHYNDTEFSFMDRRDNYKKDNLHKSNQVHVGSYQTRNSEAYNKNIQLSNNQNRGQTTTNTQAEAGCCILM